MSDSLFMYFLILFPYNLNKMKGNYSQFPEMTDKRLAIYQIDSDIKSSKELNQDLYIARKNQPNPTPTADAHQEQDVASRSIKIKGKDFDISFENGFLDEHQAAFKKQTQNLVESSLKQKQNQILGFKIFEQLRLFTASPKRLTVKEEIQFMKDLETQEKLSNFLKMIQDSVIEEVNIQLKYLTYLAWQHYLKIRDQHLSQNQLIEKAQNYAGQDNQKIFEESGIKFLNFEIVQLKAYLKQREVIKQAFSQFLRFFYTTVFLVIQEYFGNPYGEQESAKRQRSFNQYQQSEDQFSSNQSSFIYENHPCKKLSFFK